MANFELKVGDKVYRPGPWGERFSASYSVGDTRVSWLVSNWADVDPDNYNSTKISKKEMATTGTAFGYFANEQLADDYMWFCKNRHKVERAVGYLKDVAKLRQIADIIGYKED